MSICHFATSAFITQYWQGMMSVLIDFLVLIRQRINDARTTMSFGTTAEWLGGISIGNWYVERLTITHFTTSASNTEYWQGMMSDLMYFLILIRLGTY